MTKEQKRALAAVLIREAGNLVEFWEEKQASGYGDECLNGLSSNDIGLQLAIWLKDLPGDEWDTRLPCVAKQVALTGKTVVYGS